MSEEKIQLSCVSCKAYLFEDDDVVHCPECGAPHHRECYNKIGHCALEELHGTENEYDIEKYAPKTEQKSDTSENESSDYIVCNMCGEKYSKDYKKCPKCSAPDFSNFGPYAQFDFLGGVPAEYKLDEDVTAEEAKRFVAANTHRYIPKFAILSNKNKASWNWIAFLFPAGWLLSRKMYKNGIIVGVLSIIFSLLSYPFTMEVYNTGMAENAGLPQFANAFMDSFASIDAKIIILASIGVILSWILHIIYGIFGDYFYKKYAIQSIKEIKKNSDDKDADFRKKGGVNVFLFLIGTMAIEYITSFIVLLI